MKKIMFNDRYGLTQAVLDGRKTNTRRVINAPEGELEPCYHNGALTSVHLKSNHNFILNPAYRVGEEVAIAQRYSDVFHIVDENKRAIIDKINCTNKGWSNKMFVRADLMPHRIRITNVRVERLQDISDEDCLKEGIICKNERYRVEKFKGVEFYTKDVKFAFEYLIDKICGRGTWDSNPWVFVYDFELLK